MSHFYSPEELRRVKSIRGVDIVEVTQIINDEFHGGKPIRTASALKKQGFKFGGTPLWTDEQRATAIEKYEEGMSASQIGRFISKSRCAVIGWFFRQGITLKGNTRARSFGVSVTGAGNKRKTPRKKEPQAFDGFSDTPEPLSLDTPSRASHCQFIHNDDMKNPDFCKQPKGRDDNGLPLPNYCNEHHALCCPKAVPTPRTAGPNRFTSPGRGK